MTAGSLTLLSGQSRGDRLAFAAAGSWTAVHSDKGSKPVNNEASIKLSGWKLAIGAVIDRDLPLIQGVVLTFAVLFIAINLLVDMTYALLNPRLRHG